MLPVELKLYWYFCNALQTYAQGSNMRCSCHLSLANLEDAMPNEDGVRALRERNDEHAARVAEV